MTFHACLTGASGRSKFGGGQAVQVPDSVAVREVYLTPSGASQVVGITVPQTGADRDLLWEMTNMATAAVWVKFYFTDASPTPSAEVGKGRVVQPGATRYFTAFPGQTAAVINHA